MADDTKYKTQQQKRIDGYVRAIDSALNIINEMKMEQWTEESINKLFSQRGIIVVGPPQMHQHNVKYLNEFDFDRSSKKLEDMRERSKFIFSSNEWKGYNPSYQGHISSMFEAFKAEVDKFLLNQEPNVFILDKIVAFLRFISQNSDTHIDELFEIFKYGNKNYVIFGKNGSGKTKLLERVSSSILTGSSFVIPAKRNVNSIGGAGLVRQKIDLKEILSEKNNPVYYLTRAVRNRAFEEIDKKITPNIQEKFFEIFNSLGLERKIQIEQDHPYLYAEGKNKYSLIEGSDGEITVAYMIMATLLLPSNAFVFIDEPENHLNGSLMQKLFDRLEDERPDLVFIYLTHVVNFVESRKNVELIYLEKTAATPHEFKFKNVKDFDSVDLDMILSIEGTQDDIIFCEGDDKNSIDCKILESAYANYIVKPVGSCERVINCVYGLSEKYNFLRRNAYGIIDGDFRTEDEKKSLRDKNIFVLEYNELENLLIDSEILACVNKNTMDKDIEKVNKDLIKIIKKRKRATMDDYLNKRYNRILKAEKLRYNENLVEEIDSLNEKNKKTIMDEIHKYESDFDDCISRGDYNALIRLVPAKGIVDEAAQQIGIKGKDDYIGRVIKLIKQNKEVRQLVLNKIGFDIK
ncbi:MAG: DUF4435 domain-containing protein [Methanomassiliicoccaceae archaeon]|nr:DUF4435 domain-containing protein [Methanomassiliicoccaceae archaeon]